MRKDVGVDGDAQRISQMVWLLFLKIFDAQEYAHPYPSGVKSYNKTKPIRIEEFEAEKKWWGKPGQESKRKENEFAWRVPITQHFCDDKRTPLINTQL